MVESQHCNSRWYAEILSLDDSIIKCTNECGGSVVNNFIIICSVLMISACASPQYYNDSRNNALQDNLNLTTGMIYGNIQLDSSLRDIRISRLLKSGKVSDGKQIKVRTFSNGNFIAENLPQGSYVISAVVSKRKTYNNFFGKNKSAYYALHIGSGEVVYAGTYKVKQDKIKSNKYYIFRAKKPNEKEILDHIIKIEVGSIWYHPLVSRMDNLF